MDSSQPHSGRYREYGSQLAGLVSKTGIQQNKPNYADEESNCVGKPIIGVGSRNPLKGSHGEQRPQPESDIVAALNERDEPLH
jgi:hypothetical protein